MNKPQLMEILQSCLLSYENIIKNIIRKRKWRIRNE